MTTCERVMLGALGGLASVVVKFLGQDYAFLVDNIGGLPGHKQSSLIFGYAVLTPILMFLGCLSAWVSDEVKRIKLLAIAVAAPAMFTTWSGGIKYDNQHASLSIFTAAYAADTNLETAYPAYEDAADKSDDTAINKLRQGVELFFGYGKEPKRFWVIVGSYKDMDEAKVHAIAINEEDPGLNAFVGVKVLPNEYFPVIVGSYSYHDAALATKARALKSESVTDAFLSIGAIR